MINNKGFVTFYQVMPKLTLTKQFFSKTLEQIFKLPFRPDFHKPLLDISHFVILAHFRCNREGPALCRKTKIFENYLHTGVSLPFWFLAKYTIILRATIVRQGEGGLMFL